MRKLLALAAVLALASIPAMTGEWHASDNQTNLCTDCHTMHFSQSHVWDGTADISRGTPSQDGNWLGASGPNNFLLKDRPNELCLSCHNGQTFAPDVLGVNTNAMPAQGRAAGALNDPAVDATYPRWTGHTLGDTVAPPGYDPTRVGLTATWYTGTTTGLECIHCHTQHGRGTAYRNIGPRSLPATGTPTYVIGTTNDATKDVWINIPTGYTANSGSDATFNPYYASANVSYNRNDRAVGTTNTSNGMDVMCASCHGNFHGTNADSEIRDAGTTADNLDGFIRHPTGGIVIGQSGAAGYGGHSTLSRYTGATTKVKVYSDAAGYTDATPGCVSCHKAHGNLNPFGLVFLNRASASVNEEGGEMAGAPAPVPGQPAYMRGYRNLCGQCHGQGN